MKPPLIALNAGGRLDGMVFSKSLLSNEDLSGRNLHGEILVRSCLDGAILRNSDLRESES